MYLNVKSLCYTPETNITLYINYISIRKERNLKNSTTPGSDSCFCEGGEEPQIGHLGTVLQSPRQVSSHGQRKASSAQ